MKRLVTYLTKLFSPLWGLQRSDVSKTLALTVGSPSGFSSDLLLKPFIRLAAVFALLLTVGVGNAWGASYTITFATNSGDGTKASTSTAASTCTTADTYVSGNLTTASNVYYSGSDGLKLGTSSGAGDIKFGLSTSAQVVPTKVSVYAKYYNSSKKGTVQVVTNLGSNTAATTTSSFAEYYYSYSSSSELSTIEIKSSKYIWVEKVVVTYKAVVTFNANGGSCGTSSLTQSSPTSSITLPTPTRDGYTCTGWYTASSGGTKRGDAGATYTPSASETLYAQWESAATVDVTGVSVSPTSKAILVGETFTVTPTVAPANATDKTVAWTSSADGKASVNSSGLVTGVAVGSATITCTTNDGSFTASCATTVYSSSVSIVDEDGTDISASGVTATISGRTLTASEGSTQYKFKTWKYGTASGTSISSATDLSTTLTGTPTGNVVLIAEFYKPVTVSWTKGGSAYSTGTPTTSVKRGTQWKDLTIPTAPGDASLGACANKFKGWTNGDDLIGTGNSEPAVCFTSVSGITTEIIAPIEFKAVFATSYTTKVPTPGTYTHTISSQTWSTTGAQTLNSKSWTLANNGSYYGYDGTKGQQVGSGTYPASTMSLSSSAFSGTITSVKISTSGASSVSATVGVSVGSTDFTKDGDGETTSVSISATNTEYTFTGSATGTIAISWSQSSSKALYFKKIVVGYTTMEDGTGYKDYVTQCCTELDAINGSINWSNPTEAVLTWDNVANVSSWSVSCIVHGGSSAGSVGGISTNGAGKKTCTITGLTCNTNYDFTITASPASGYCDKAEVLEDQNSGKWTVGYTLSGVTKSSGPDAGANVCGNYSAVFAVSSVAYALPSDVTVTIGGVTKTKDTDYTWNSSTGALSIDAAKITGTIAITVTADLVGCSADPTIGAVSLSGTFNLGTVGVTVGTSSTGANTCAWTDYGFVWGTSANPTVSNTKVQLGTDGTATSWSGNLTGSFSTGTTYYYRAYGKNSKDAAAYVYSSSDGTFTPRSVVFDLNGHGEAIATQILNTGGTASEPDEPSETGWTFNGWKLSGSSYNFSSTVNSDITLVADWSQNNYTVTMAQSPSAGASLTGGTTTAHYGGTINISTDVPSGYVFTGWTSSPSVTFANASSTSTSFTMPASSVTITANFKCGVTWMVNGEEWTTGTNSGNTQVANGSKVASLPTAPTTSDCDDSKVFVGWRATAIAGTSAGNPGSIFTTQAASPAITANTTFYAVFADVSGGNSLTLTFPDDNSENNGLSNYTSTWTAKAGTFEFSIANFNNNSWGGSWTFIKCGRKDYASVASITTGSDIDFRVDSVLVTLESITASKVNSAKLQISSASDFGTTTDMDIPQSSGIQRLKIASPATDKYYRIKYDCASNTSNGFVSISKLVFKQNLDTANYVTSCASCDADATYTNTTPTVSDIDCTGATLTATGGLATVGADGCHISDYGFVIGTADNPAIGGVGVTKYQVGTSDPTTGTDFSYDATGLTKGTHYYIRAYATNRHGTAYSSSTNFWTKNVSSIAITTAPTKTNYLVGETFNATGMVVTATMADDSEDDVTEDVTYSSSALTAGANQDFAINYSLCETDKSVNQKINVYTLTVVEGTNPSYGVASGSVNIVSITGLGEHKTYSLTVTSSNATAVDNGDNTWTITNPTGNVTVTVNYRDAEQVKVYYKVDGVTVTGLTQDVYESETTTLPTASQLATAMTAQSMDIPDDDYPNFWGWSETEFPAQAAEPTIVTGTPTISAEKIYYAVYTNMTKKQILPSNFSGTYSVNDGAQTYDGVGYYISNICLNSSKIQFRNSPGYLYSTSALQYIKKIEITGLDLVVNACSDNAGTLDGDAITPTGTAPYVYTFPASKQYFKIKGKGGTDKVSLIEIFYANATVYYMTQFCATKITLTQNNPSNGTVAFSRSSLATCGSDKNVSLTITPALGYQLTGWTVNTTSGYADAKTTSPAVVTNSNNSTVQNITLTFAQDATDDYDVTATFGLMTVSSWTWTHNSAAIPDPLNLYVGQSARLDVAYTPAGVDASKKTYTRNKDDAYINWVGALQTTYSTISGRASTGENTTAVTFTHADGPSTTVNVKVLPLPSVHFVDNVHNESFSDVVATLSDNALSPTKTTPTHADYDGSTLNTCEEQHLHLVGWIREDWPALVTYMNGGAQPNTAAITGAGNDDSGNAYFFAPGASINTLTFNGVTFYAVWAKVE